MGGHGRQTLHVHITSQWRVDANYKIKITGRLHNGVIYRLFAGLGYLQSYAWVIHGVIYGVNYRLFTD
jgi:hypothetical protein